MTQKNLIWPFSQGYLLEYKTYFTINVHAWMDGNIILKKILKTGKTRYEEMKEYGLSNFSSTSSEF